MQIKELAELSGIKRQTIASYLGAREKSPSAEAAVKIARVLGVSVEYLVCGNDGNERETNQRLSADSYAVAHLTEQLSASKRKFVLDFIRWVKDREERG